MQWYYAIDGQRLGPVTHSEFERLVQAGTISGDALVWRQGLDQWKTLSAVMARDPAMFAGMPPPLPAVEAEPVFEEEVELAEPEAPRVSGLQARAVPVEAEAPVLAGFWLRFGAQVVDFLLWWIVWQLLIGVVGTKYFPEAMAIAQKGPGYQVQPDELIMLVRFLGTAFFIGLVWAIVYDLFFLLRFAATPGKLLFGIRLAQADGQPLGFMRIVARCLAKGLAGFPTLGIGFLIAAFDDQKRGLHDFFCNTRVFKKR
ncbi:RDD family protein [Rariglobus hedericola]|uniref:RDD family protein n=1 Tax=Rariglobus hedericola TaxID=2597822 RepID=A0A556QJZ0_9BACT|nr:RDD family protein [Rariglobus hedericola]TSJ76956.1 RDD family protein [Rariglobus hedericola]